jgi:hypothetical protein
MNFLLANGISIVGKTIGFILLVLAYLYIKKLEEIGCDCAEHPYRNRIQTYLKVAIGYFLITIFLPPSLAVRYFGPLVGVIYVLIDIIFTLVSIVFFVLMMQYIKYLSVEKCKCSEGNTREILYIYSVVEVILLSLLVILPILTSIIKGVFALAVTTVQDIKGSTGTVTESVFNPLKALKEVPRAVSRDARDIASLPKTAFKGVKKVLSRSRK